MIFDHLVRDFLDFALGLLFCFHLMSIFDLVRYVYVELFDSCYNLKSVTFYSPLRGLFWSRIVVVYFQLLGV